MQTAKTMLARAIGIQAGSGCHCAVCGDSPFAAAGPRAAVLGGNFTAVVDLADRDAPHVCAGCARLLAGRPGDDPPPLRTTSFVCIDGALRPVRVADLWQVLTAPPAGPFVASWAVSRKTHHWLHAGVSTAHEMRIGSDAGCIEFRPIRDAVLCDAVHAMLYAPTETSPLLSRTAIVTGDYHPSAAAKFGAERLRRLEETVDPYRGSGLLDLVVACAPISTHREDEEQEMISDDLKTAARVLAHVAGCSAIRSADGKMFWGGFFRHRVERFKALPLSRMVSRLMDECSCEPVRATQLAGLVGSLVGDREDAVMDAIRNETALAVTIAFEAMQAARTMEVAK